MELLTRYYVIAILFIVCIVSSLLRKFFLEEATTTQAINSLFRRNDKNHDLYYALFFKYLFFISAILSFVGFVTKIAVFIKHS